MLFITFVTTEERFIPLKLPMSPRSPDLDRGNRLISDHCSGFKLSIISLLANLRMILLKSHFFMTMSSGPAAFPSHRLVFAFIACGLAKGSLVIPRSFKMGRLSSSSSSSRSCGFFPRKSLNCLYHNFNLSSFLLPLINPFFTFPIFYLIAQPPVLTIYVLQVRLFYFLNHFM